MRTATSALRSPSTCLLVFSCLARSWCSLYGFHPLRQQQWTLTNPTAVVCPVSPWVRLEMSTSSASVDHRLPSMLKRIELFLFLRNDFLDFSSDLGFVHSPRAASQPRQPRTATTTTTMINNSVAATTVTTARLAALRATSASNLPPATRR